MRGWRARYEEEQIKSRQYDRNGPIKLKWQDRAGLVAELFIDDALWAFVEWSEKRQQFSDPAPIPSRSLRPRLVVWVHSVVLDLQGDPVSPIPLMSTRNDLCKRVAQEVMDRLQSVGIDVVSR